jgi:hypothetical protein
LIVRWPPDKDCRDDENPPSGMEDRTRDTRGCEAPRHGRPADSPRFHQLYQHHLSNVKNNHRDPQIYPYHMYKAGKGKMKLGTDPGTLLDEMKRFSMIAKLIYNEYK